MALTDELTDPTINENSSGPQNAGFPGGTKGYVTGLPVNPLFNFKANGLYTYNTDYLLPLYVDATTSELQSTSSGDILLADGFDSLANGATITDTFTVEYTSGETVYTDEITVTITGVNDDPTAVDDTHGVVVANGSAGVTINVLANDYDIDTFDNETTEDTDLLGDTFTIVGTGGTSTEGGSWVNNSDGTVDYIPPADFIGIDTFSYTIEDQWGATDTATVTVVVGPTNTPPTATDDSYSVSEDDGLTPYSNDDVAGGGIGVLDNDTDPESDTLGALLKTDVYHANAAGVAQANPNATGTGDIVLSVDGSFTYNPEGSFNYLALGESAYVAYEYTAFDGDLNSSDDATVVIEIQGENDVPDAAEPAEETVYEAGLATAFATGSGEGLPGSFPAGETSTTVTGTIAVTDPDLTDTHFISKVDGADVPGDGVITGAGYTLTISGLTYTYELTDNRTTHDTQGRSIDDITNVFTLTISDDNGAESLTDTVTLTVNIVDDQPVIATDFGVGSISQDETDSAAGTNFTTVANIVSGLDTAVTPGADDIATQLIALTDSTGAAFDGDATNLIDTVTGSRIFLYDNSGVVEGRVGTSADAATGADMTGAVAFSFALINGDSDSADGLLTQNRAVYHWDDGDPNDTVTLKAADGTTDLIYVTVTVDDGDVGPTDTLSATSDTAVTLSFVDDAPALASIESGYVDFAAGTSEGASTGLDFGYDGAGGVELTAFTPLVEVFQVGSNPSVDDPILSLAGVEGPDNTVIYSDGGTDYFALVLDPVTGNYTMEVLADAPEVSNPVLFDSVSAGSPMGRYEFATLTDTFVGFQAYKDVTDDGDNAANLPLAEGLNGDIKDAILNGDPNLTVNPSEQGFGGGNNNTDPNEAYVIDTVDGDGNPIQTSGVNFDVGKATGGIGSVIFKWEAYSGGLGNGTLVAEGTIVVPKVPKPGAEDVPVTIDLPDGVTADTYYILPEIEDDKGAFAITKVEIFEPGALADFAFDFSAVAKDEDGDPTATRDFTVGVDGADDGYDGPGAPLVQLDPYVALVAPEGTDTFSFALPEIKNDKAALAVDEPADFGFGGISRFVFGFSHLAGDQDEFSGPADLFDQFDPFAELALHTGIDLFDFA